MARPVHTHTRSRGAHDCLPHKNLWRSRAGRDPSPGDQISGRAKSLGRGIHVLVYVYRLWFRNARIPLSRSQFPGKNLESNRWTLWILANAHIALYTSLYTYVYSYIYIYAYAYSYSCKWMQRYCTTKLKNKSMNFTLGWMPQLEVETVLQLPLNFCTSEWASKVPLTSRMLWTTLIAL